MTTTENTTTTTEDIALVFHCIHTTKWLDPAIGYCPDCNRMDCAVSAKELLDFHTNEGAALLTPDNAETVLPLHQLIIATYEWEFRGDRTLLNEWMEQNWDAYYSADLYDEIYEMLKGVWSK